MGKFITGAISAICLIGGFGGARWMRPGKAELQASISAALPEPLKSSSRSGFAPAGRETSKLHPPAGSITLRSLLKDAATGSPLAAEANLLILLQPLGKHRWSELFAELDPGDGPAEAVGILRRALLRIWASKEPAGALQALARHGRPWSLANVEIVVNGVTSRGWDFAQTALKGVNGSVGANGKLLLAAWAQEHAPEHAAEAMNLYSSGRTPGMGIPPPLMAGWVERDRTAAEAWMGTLTNPSTLKEVQTGYCLGLAKGDIGNAAAWVEAIPSDSRREELRKTLKNWIVKEGNVRETAKFLAGNPDAGHALFGSLAHRWANEDPKSALKWAVSLPADSQARADALSAYAGVRTNHVRNWNEALEVASALPDGASRRECLTKALLNLPPSEGVQHLGLAVGEHRNAAWLQVLTGSPPLPLDQAMALAPAYAAEKDSYLVPLAERLLAERSPGEALDWVLTLPEGPRMEAEAEVWDRWAARDVPAALARAAALTEAPARQAALSRVAGQWARMDPLAATSWFAAQPSGPARDAAAAGMVPEIIQTDPAGALDWAAVIGDPATRGRLLEEIRPPARLAPTDHWKAAVENSTLTQAEKAQLLTQP